MATKKKKSGRGGARKGAGRKETGKTTNTVCFSVPKGQEENIKTLVKTKLAEIKGGVPVEEVVELKAGDNKGWAKAFKEAGVKATPSAMRREPYMSDAIKKKLGR